MVPPSHLNWRSMTQADLDGVVEVARLSFPNHPEERACFANRLALHPRGCFVLGDEDGGVFGYLAAYPWTRGSAPALNALIPALPEAADLVYLHDLALRPDARGAGHARPVVEQLAKQARSDGWPALALVAVNDAAAFWERLGFVAETPPDMAGKLAGYGPDARYMVRPL